MPGGFEFWAPRSRASLSPQDVQRVLQQRQEVRAVTQGAPGTRVSPALAHPGMGWMAAVSRGQWNVVGAQTRSPGGGSPGEANLVHSG